MTEQTSLADRITKLEELLANQDHFIEQLNQVILELREEHDAMRTKFSQEISRLESLVEDTQSPFDPDEKPPHY